MTYKLHIDDLPDDFVPNDVVAVDTETMGLDHARDRLCLVQLSNGDGKAEIVQLKSNAASASNLVRILTDEKVVKLFHFARFDLAALMNRLGVMASPVYCTKIASRLTRTYTNQHGLKALLLDCLELELSKERQSSDWGAESLTDEQLVYAASDVLHLHRVKRVLDQRLAREGREDLAKACFEFLPTRAHLDLEGWASQDIFAH